MRAVPGQPDLNTTPASLLFRTYHGICKGRGNGYCHPPHETRQEVLTLATDQVADQPAVEFSDIQTEHCPQHEEDAVADEQPKLLAAPAGYHDLQKAKQVSQKLAIQLDPLPGRARAFVTESAGPWPGPQLFLSLRGGLLLCDGIANAVGEREEEGEVDSARDAGAVSNIQARQVRDDLSDGALRREQLGLRSHGSTQQTRFPEARSSTG